MKRKQKLKSFSQSHYIVAVVPAFNEELRISSVLKDLKKYVDHVIVVDDGSVDNTSNVSHGKKVTVLRHIVNLGQGAAIQTGFEKAKILNADIVLTFDADGQFKAHEIREIIKPLLSKKTDIVLGSRFLGKKSNMPLSKNILLKCALIFTKLYSKINLTDTHNGFRALNKKAYQAINLVHNRMSHASEIIHQIKKHNLKYNEIAVTVTYDNYSKLKGQKMSGIINILFDLLLKRQNKLEQDITKIVREIALSHSIPASRKGR